MLSVSTLRRSIWASAHLRLEMFRAMARRHNVPAIVVNQVGGNDQMVFDGTSFAMDAEGNVIASAASFREDLVMADTGDRRRATGTPNPTRRVRSGLRSAGARARAITSASAASDEC